MGSILASYALSALVLTSVQQADQYSLKFSPKEGTAITYKMSGEMNIQGNQASLDSTVIQKILKVDSDGTYSVQSNTVSGKVIFAGQEMEVPKNVAVTIYKPNGEVVSVSGEQVDPTNLRSQNLTMLKRPDANVKIGDSWQVENKADTAAGKPSLHGTFKLVGEEAVGTYHTLRIDANISEGDVPLPGNTTTSFWIDKTDGSIVKYDCKYVNLTFAGAPSPMTGSLSMMRVDKP